MTTGNTRRSMATQPIQIKYLAAKLSRQSAGLKALLGLLCLLFVTAQAIDLTHSLEGDLNLQADCDICLKLSSDDDVLLSSNDVAPKAPVSLDVLSTIRELPVAEILTAHARAPPLA